MFPKYNMFASDEQYRLSQDPASRLRLTSSFPGYDDYQRMVNDDECAVHVCVSVFVCGSVLCVSVCVFFAFFHSKLLCLTRGNVKSHMSHDRSGYCNV